MLQEIRTLAVGAFGVGIAFLIALLGFEMLIAIKDIAIVLLG